MRQSTRRCIGVRWPIPEAFWAAEARKLEWMQPFTNVKDVSFDAKNLHIRWFYDGTLNVSVNCIDRHLKTRGNQTAIIWEGDDPKTSRHITYAELHREVCRFANVLKANGVQRGDRVTIYLPMIPEVAYAMLACARIGAIHSVVFAGFSPDSLAGRIIDCASELVITADEGVRGGKAVPLKRNTDVALTQCPSVKRVIVVKHTGAKALMHDGTRRLVSRRSGEGVRRLPAGRDGGGGSAVHPLHVRLDGKAQGRAAYVGGLSLLRRVHAQIRLRLSRRRHLLVHRRCRLGDGAQLYPLRPARERRDHADVRRHPELSDARRGSGRSSTSTR